MDAFDTAYNMYWEMLYLQAYRLLKDDALARDVVQEVFTSLFLSMGKISPQVPLKYWLQTCVKNKVFNHIRHERVKEDYLASLSTYALNKESTTDRVVREKELQVIIEEEIARLPQKMRNTFELSRKEYLNVHEISKITSTSVGTVKKQVQEALKKLRYKLLPLYKLRH